MRLGTHVNTLFVFLVVVAFVLAIGAVLPSLLGKSEEAKIRTANAQLSRLSHSIRAYEMDVGAFPTALEELIDKEQQNSCWRGLYIKRSMLQDPWGTSYKYEIHKNHFRLISYGQDKRLGGEGRNADITLEVKTHNKTLNKGASDAGAG